MSSEIVQRVLEIAATIPPGRVASYGEVGAAAGLNAPRAVGRIMAEHGSSVAWWRVVYADGRPPASTPQALQTARERYAAEGTPTTGRDPETLRIRREAFYEFPVGDEFSSGSGSSAPPAVSAEEFNSSQ